MLNEVILRILMAVYRARRLVLIKEWGVCFGGGSQGAFEVGHGRLDVCVVGHDHNWSIEETCQKENKKGQSSRVLLHPIYPPYIFYTQNLLKHSQVHTLRFVCVQI